MLLGGRGRKRSTHNIDKPKLTPGTQSYESTRTFLLENIAYSKEVQIRRYDSISLNSPPLLICLCVSHLLDPPRWAVSCKVKERDEEEKGFFFQPPSLPPSPLYSFSKILHAMRKEERYSHDRQARQPLLLLLPLLLLTLPPPPPPQSSGGVTLQKATARNLLMTPPKLAYLH